MLVRMRAASVNALDWHSTHGGLLLEIIGKIMRQQDETVRGVDLAGTVDSVGPNVTRFKPGDEVFGGAPASFAEFVRAREDRLLLKPRDLPFDQAATLNVAGRTALQGLRCPGGALRSLTGVGEVRHGGPAYVAARVRPRPPRAAHPSATGSLRTRCTAAGDVEERRPGHYPPETGEHGSHRHGSHRMVAHDLGTAGKEHQETHQQWRSHHAHEQRDPDERVDGAGADEVDRHADHRRAMTEWYSLA